MFVSGCEFCRISHGQEHAEVVYEAARWIAFVPLNPATPGHLLVVPRDHVSNLWEADGDLARELMQGVVKVGQSLRKVVSPDGMNLITSAGTVAEQTVFHLHLHVVPRWHNDGFGTIWPVGERYDVEDLGDVTSSLRAHLASGGA